MLRTYKNEKNKILNQYKKILKLPNILPKDISIENIKEKQKQLEEEHFFVSFTGQIKAGKSTLINALLFGEEIIPADDTPHTAKITIIKYGEEPRIEATFYNKEEWKALESNQDFYEEYLKPDIEKSINQGLFVDEFINTNAKVQKENGLDNLKEYVARKGKYTPFVNLVTLYHPNEILKEITIVDTPGTNDPNEQRDKVAKEWIHKTNANIYITYAGQAMDKVDIEFIDNFLLAVPKEQKLTVINKIDSVNDSDGLEEYITELLANKSLQRREVVSDRDSLILVSGLGALIDKMSTKNLPLNEDLEFYAEQLEEKGFLEPENHGLSRLEKMIEQKLIENKGKNIIESHSMFLDSIFRKRINEIEQKLSEKKSSLLDLMKSKEELEVYSKNIENNITLIATKQEQIEKKFTHLINENVNCFASNQKRQNQEIIKKIKEKIYKIKNISNYENEIRWIVKDAIDENFDNLKTTLKEIIEILSKSIENEMTNLESELLNQGVTSNFTSPTFYIYTLDLIEGMRKLVEKGLAKNNIYDIVKENKKFFQSNKNNKNDISKAIINEVREKFEQDYSNNMIEIFTQKLKNSILEDTLCSIFTKLTISREKKRKEISKYIQNENPKDDLIKKSKEEKESLEKKLEIIKKYQEEIK